MNNGCSIVSLLAPPRRLIALFGCVCAAFAGIAATAQDREIEFPISPTPIGAGARAAGMADAFVAIADDATAASWNPAGLVQLEVPEFSIVGSFNTISEDFLSRSHPEIEETFSDDSLDLNFASFVYPIPSLIGDRNAVISLSYQHKYDLSRNHDFPFTTRLVAADSTTADIDQTFLFKQQGSFSTISPAIAIELTNTLSVGATVNFWRSSFLSDNSLKQTEKIDQSTIITVPGLAPFPPIRLRRTSETEYSDFKGENFTLGLLWNITPKWNLGLRYDTAFTGEADFKQRVISNINGRSSAREQRYISFPDTLALGVSWRANDRLTLAADVSKTDWNDMTVKTANGSEFSLIDSTQLDNKAALTDFDDTYTVRFGVEYVMLPKNLDSELNYLWTLRGGLFYDEEPASGRSDFTASSKGSGEPDSFYGLTLGLGLLAHQRTNLDLAYQVRFADGVNKDLVQGIPGFEEDVMQHRVLLSAVIYF